MDKKNPNKTFKRPIGDKKTVVLSKGHFSLEVSQEDVTQTVKVIKNMSKRDFNNDIHWFGEKDEEVEPEPTCGNPCTNPCAEAPLYGRDEEDIPSSRITTDERGRIMYSTKTEVKKDETVNPCADLPPYDRDEDAFIDKLYEDELERYNEDEEDR